MLIVFLNAVKQWKVQEDPRIYRDIPPVIGLWLPLGSERGVSAYLKQLYDTFGVPRSL